MRSVAPSSSLFEAFRCAARRQIAGSSPTTTAYENRDLRRTGATLNILALCLAAASAGLSARAEPIPADLPEIGPHHQVIRTGARAYVAVANGMHYLDGGELKRSDP